MVWFNSPLAAKGFLQTSFVDFSREDLRNLIIKRIGVDNLIDKINYISKSEYFAAAVKSPEVR